MSEFLTTIFGIKSIVRSARKNAKARLYKSSVQIGRLETDAMPCGCALDCEYERNHNASADSAMRVMSQSGEINNSISTPTSSASMEMLRTGESFSVGDDTMSTNAYNQPPQQQIVMQFSNVSELHFGSVYNFCSEEKTCRNERSTAKDRVTRRPIPQKTTTVVALMQSQREPDCQMLQTIAKHLGDGWKNVMRNLGHSEGQIEQAIIDHQIHGGIKEVIYQLLLQWVRNADDGEATIGHITTLLWQLNHRECVQRMKFIYKLHTGRNSSI